MAKKRTRRSKRRTSRHKRRRTAKGIRYNWNEGLYFKKSTPKASKNKRKSMSTRLGDYIFNRPTPGSYYSPKGPSPASPAELTTPQRLTRDAYINKRSNQRYRATTGLIKGSTANMHANSLYSPEMRKYLNIA